MIRVPCKCKHVLELDESEAGSTVQCPQCGLLCDVPHLGDIAAMESDGTFRVDQPPGPLDPDEMRRIHLAWQRDKVDEEGNEIDLRPSYEEMLAAGAVEPDNNRPHYDPGTGELIRSHQLKDEVAPQEIPMARAIAPALNYARGPAGLGDSPAPATIGQIALALFRPVNLLVMFVIVIMNVLLLVGVMLVSAHLYLFVLVPLTVSFFLLAHYGTVIDEVGREDRDELPRPFRNLSWQDDLWGPFTAVFFSLMVCFLPCLAVLVLPRHREFATILAMGWVLPGCIAFPAVLVSASLGGTLHNLRPDRVWSVASTFGAAYARAVVLFILVLVFIGLSVGVIQLGAARYTTVPAFLDSGWAQLSFMIASIYMTHMLGWYLGVLYHAHHPEFTWIMHSRRPRKPAQDRPVKRPRRAIALRPANSK